MKWTGASFWQSKMPTQEGEYNPIERLSRRDGQEDKTLDALKNYLLVVRQGTAEPSLGWAELKF